VRLTLYIPLAVIETLTLHFLLRLWHGRHSRRGLNQRILKRRNSRQRSGRNGRQDHTNRRKRKGIRFIRNRRHSQPLRRRPNPESPTNGVVHAQPIQQGFSVRSPENPSDAHDTRRNRNVWRSVPWRGRWSRCGPTQLSPNSKRTVSGLNCSLLLLLLKVPFPMHIPHVRCFFFNVFLESSRFIAVRNRDSSTPPSSESVPVTDFFTRK
jgi:hypothetical protein